MMPELDILDYSDYRKFLKDVYGARKQQRAHYSYRACSAELGFKASNFLHLIASGKRNLSPVGVIKIQKAFAWIGKRQRYFAALVSYNQSQNSEERRVHAAELTRILGKKQKIISTEAESYFDYWYIPVIREMVCLKNFVSNLNWISKKLLPVVDETKVRDALNLLERLNMLKKVKGVWRQVEAHLTTPLEVASSILHAYHRQLIQLSEQALQIAAKDRDITAVTMALSPQQFQQLKERLAEWRDEIQNNLESATESSTRVYLLNMQLFPITK